MTWTSILPPSLSTLETWLVNFFLLGALFTIGPWAAFVVYDIVLYLVRTLAYELPIVGGRSQGQARPRAPSLSERPDGQPRRFSLAAATSGREQQLADHREAARSAEINLKDSMFDD